jgi:ATP-binding cassette subfamily B protein IrtA
MEKREKSPDKTQEKEKPAFSWVLSQAGAHRKQYTVSVILAVFGVCCAMGCYFVIAGIVRQLIEGNHSLSIYFRSLGLLVILWLARTLLHSISTVMSHRATFQTLAKIRENCCEKLTRMSLGDVLERSSGELKNIIVERVDSIETTLAHILPEFTANLLVPLLVLIYMFVVNWKMAFAALITVPLGLICCRGMMKDYQKNYARTVRATRALNDTAVEYIDGIQVIKAFGKTKSSYARFVDAAKEASASFVDWMYGTSWYFAFAMSIMPATLISVLPIGGILYRAGSLTAEQFVLLIVLSFGLIQPIITCMSYSDDLATMRTIVEEIRSILDNPELVRQEAASPETSKAASPETSKAADALQTKDAGVELSDVHFGYRGEEVLHGVSLSMPPHSYTAIVGPSGSGKTTIARLIDRLWDVTSGSVKIGGRDVRSIPEEERCGMIAYVSQDNFLFDQSIMENIRIGKVSGRASDEEVIEAAKRCGCHEFITRLENGYDTVAGTSGSHLSGGERQRICIARAMLKDAPIVILDEATAYTDPENEALIQESLSGLVQGKTLIVIAHRLSTVADADQIIVISGGRVDDIGTHEELLARKGLYSRMWAAHISARDSDDESAADAGNADNSDNSDSGRKGKTEEGFKSETAEQGEGRCLS